ncbi:hypothetical protein [Kitasatospora sp. NBC_01302]|uniref:hypothetical protein n=1 Tax=Kitasatospora sp. NBC_01302 TaxID=2903575 RepID=UPI002E0E6C89|nr:hypothetical protein OG294_13720 [Kitasatospora sp. NBC_01302]
MTAAQIHKAAQRYGCSDAEMALMSDWMDDHGAPCEWDEDIEAGYKKALDELHAAEATS